MDSFLRRLRPWKPKAVYRSLPEDLRLIVADVGSIGGLHKRWRELAGHLVTINFDPLDDRISDSEKLNLPVLLGDREGEAELQVTRRASMSSTLDPNRDFFAPFWRKSADVEITETSRARMSTLDTILAEKQFSPDAIKIDVQGGEGAVLDGAGETLRRSIILAEIECSFAERYVGQQTIDEVIARMRRSGFALLDIRRLKRYQYRNSAGVNDPSIGNGMRAGRLAFCDVIFVLEPEILWQRIAEGGGENGPQLGLKAVLLFLTYGKADLAAATFDRSRDSIPDPARKELASFFASLKGDGGWRNRLHHRFDAWARSV